MSPSYLPHISPISSLYLAYISPVSPLYLPAQLRYTDEHTHVDNVCGSGGANVPALNRLLAPLGIGFRSVAVSGSVSLGGRAFDYLSGAAISAFPAAALLLHASLTRATKLRQPGRRDRRDILE